MKPSKKKVSKEQLVKLLKASHELASSPVAYTTPLVEKVLLQRLSIPEFRKAYKEQTKDSQFYFFRLPQAVIEENRRVFGPEFAYADTLTRLVKGSYRQMPETDFQEALCQAIADYLAARAEA